MRLRSVLDTIAREYRGERVLIVGHQAIANCLRYLLERCDEQAILAIDKAANVPSCGIASYAFDTSLGKHGKLQLELCNFAAPLEATGTQITAQPDMPAEISALLRHLGQFGERKRATAWRQIIVAGVLACALPCGRPALSRPVLPLSATSGLPVCAASNQSACAPRQRPSFVTAANLRPPDHSNFANDASLA